MTTYLEQLQQRVGQKIAHLTPQIPVICYHPSCVQKRIDSVVKQGSGCCVLILHPLPQRVRPGVRGPIFEQVRLRIQLIENTYTLPKDLSILSLAQTISQNLHLECIQIGDWNACIQLQEKNPWQELKSPYPSTRSILQLEFLTTATL